MTPSHSKPLPQHACSAADLLPVARRLVPHPLTLETYIAELNAHTGATPPITPCLPHAPATAAERVYTRLISRLIVAFPPHAAVRFPPNAGADRRHPSATASPDRLLADVITSALRRHGSGFAAGHANVLCAGFDHAKQHGPGSALNNLDARSPSASIQVLRTPPWHLLLRTLGYTVLRHLLASATLLLCVDGSDEAPLQNMQAARKRKPPCVLLQLCGPFALGVTKSQYCRLPQSASTVVLKQDLMYKTPKRQRCDVNGCTNPGLPVDHHLNHLADASAAAVILQHVIFPPTDVKKNKYSSSARNYDKLAIRLSPTALSSKRGKEWLARRKALPKRLGKVVPLLAKVFTGLRARSFRRVLSLFAPFGRPKSPGAAEALSKAQLLALNTPPKGVSRFVIACLKQLIPRDLLGPPSHYHLLERAVHSFICHRRQRETFDVRRFFLAESGLSLTAVPWLWRHKARGSKGGDAGAPICNPTDFQFRRDRMLDLLVWITRGVIIPLLQQNFFVTEGTVNRNRVLFFRREVWSQLVDKTMFEILRTNARFSVLSTEQLRSCVQRRSDVIAHLGWRHFPAPSFHHHELRFIPKKSSMRGIQRPRVKPMTAFHTIGKHSPRTRGTNKKGFRFVTSSVKSMRLFMRNIHAVLMAELRAQPHLLGASVFSLDEIYPKYLNLVQTWKGMGKPKLYFCCFDITNSFDTIPLKQLFEDVVPEALARGRYPIVKFRASKHDTFGNLIRSKFSTHVCLEAGDEASFSRLLRKRIASRESGAVVTDLANMATVGRDEVLQGLNEFLCNNLISVPKRYRANHETAFAIQAQGLPQGHPLSSLLTSLFYGHVERNDLGEFLHGRDGNSDKKGGEATSLLMRLVDDTIFASSSKKLTSLFMQRMTAGWKSSHGFSVNKQKTRTSFGAGFGGAENLKTIPWCGLLIDVETLEVRGDYERYCDGGNRLRDSLSIEQEWEAGRILCDRAASCFKPKLHPLLLDPRINSAATVALNAYQAAVLACLKLCAHVLVLRPNNPNMFEGLVERAAGNFQRLVCSATAKRTATLHRCRTTLTGAQIRYLTAHAFRSCLDRRLSKVASVRQAVQPCVSKMAEVMREALCHIGGRDGQQLEQMADAFSRRACDALWRIAL